jgi:hypothetical protein
MLEQDETHIAARSALLGQFLRYGVTGGFVTLIGVGVYWVVATWFGYAPLLATLLAYLVRCRLVMSSIAGSAFAATAAGIALCERRAVFSLDR